MLKNNKGFTLIEVLSTVTILGIIGTIVTVSVSRYLAKSKLRSYTMMSQSIYEAVENCIIENVCNLEDDEIKTETLKNYGYIKNLESPKKGAGECSGTVNIKDNDPSQSQNNAYKNYSYEVKLNCPGVANKTLTWPEAKKTEKINEKYKDKD